MKVYYSSDPFEKALQDAAHQTTGQWMSERECRLMASAISSLKLFSPDWVGSLSNHRASYFFLPHFISLQDQLVFVTSKLYARDVVENNEINSFLHSPVVLMTKPLAHYLFKEYPIHIHIDRHRLLSLNSGVKFAQLGGLVICEDNVALDKDCILGIAAPENRTERFDREQSQLKSAASLVAPGVFKIDEHERTLLPDMEVWDKDNRVAGRIAGVEPGETGSVQVSFEDGLEVEIGKQFFDQRFSLV